MRSNTTKTIAHLIQALNARAEAAGCSVRAEHIDVDRTWGDLDGVALAGGSEADRERAALYVRAWSRRHLAPRNSYDVQFAYADHGAVECIRGPLKKELWIKARLVNPQPEWVHVQARVIALLYFPCAE